MTTTRRPCLDCAAPAAGTRCVRCERAHDAQRQRARGSRYDHAWTQHSRQTRAAWVAEHGWVCPGWRTEPHPSDDLVVDHDEGVMCRTCNAVKAATVDKARKRAEGGWPLESTTTSGSCTTPCQASRRLGDSGTSGSGR